jgi:hypothetical protein
MGRGAATLVFASIVLVSFALCAVILWQALAHHVPLSYVVGGGVVVIGISFVLLNAGVTDEYLRRHHLSEENVARMREMWRGGWVGVLGGAVLIAAEYFLGVGL